MEDVPSTEEVEVVSGPKGQGEESVQELRPITPASVSDFEERFLKQEQDLENLRNRMQAKVTS